MKLGDPKTVGEMMRKRRKDLGFTIEQFAQATGVSPITIMRIELGRVGYVHEKTAKALEVPQKVVRRLVMQPVAVGQDGNDMLTPNVHALPGPMRERLSGDAEALSTGAANTREEKRRRVERRQVTEPLRGKLHTISPLKKFLLWMAEKA